MYIYILKISLPLNSGLGVEAGKKETTQVTHAQPQTFCQGYVHRFALGSGLG